MAADLVRADLRAAFASTTLPQCGFLKTVVVQPLACAAESETCVGALIASAMMSPTDAAETAQTTSESTMARM